MSPHGCRKRSAKPCNRYAEENFLVLGLNNQTPKPPNYLLIQDKAFYSLGLDPGWARDILRAVFHPPGQSEGLCGRCDTASQRAVDDAGGAQHHDGGVGLPGSRAVPN